MAPVLHFLSMIYRSCHEHWHRSKQHILLDPLAFRNSKIMLPFSVTKRCVCRQRGFHLWDFLLGVLLTTAITGFLYYRVRNTGLKALNRERQSFAVRVCTYATLEASACGCLAQFPPCHHRGYTQGFHHGVWVIFPM